MVKIFRNYLLPNRKCPRRLCLPLLSEGEIINLIITVYEDNTGEY